MTVPFKLQILHALTDVIKDVPTLADFDPGDGSAMQRVFRGRAWFGDSDPVPMVSILEGVNPADELYEAQPDNTSGEYDWQILVQGFVADDAANPTDPAYYLMRDVRTRLMQEKSRRKLGRHTPDPLGASTFAPLGCALLNITVGPGVVRPADDVSSKAWFWMSLTLRIVEDGETA